MDTWIVTGYDYTRHMRLDIAEREARRLREEEPHKHYRIYRVKTTLPAANTRAVLKAASDVCDYVGYNLKHIKDPILVGLVCKMQYEIAMRIKSMQDEDIEEAYLLKEHADA